MSLRSVLLIIVPFFGCSIAQTAGKKPNILIIFADDMGYGDSSYAGHPTILTPNLDKLAAEGTRFTQWYSAFHVCSPSRAAMLTGRLPTRSGCAGNSWTGGVFSNDAVGGLPENEITFADILGSQGYASLAIGKWHLGQQPKFLPTSHGFDEYFGIPYSVDMAKSAWDDNAFGAQVPLPLLHNLTVIEQPVDLNTLDERYAAKAVQFIKRNAAQQKPFLLYFACNHVHVPDYASKSFCNESKRGRFGDAIAEMDASIGTLMKGLKESGADEDTLVFFTSDNGPWLIQKLSGGSAGPFFEGKTTTWEGGIRVPGIARWPGKVAAGAISQAMVQTTDIFATAVALAGSELPKDRAIDGKDLSRVLLRGEQSPHECLFHYKGVPSKGFPAKENEPQPGLWAVRCGAYKVHYVTQCSQLNRVHDARCSPDAALDKDHVDGRPEYYGRATAPRIHDPPLLFNVEQDVGEMYPLDTNSKEYKEAMEVITRAKKEHEATMLPVTSQMGLGQDKDLATCCDPKSLDRLPTYPNCTCNPDHFDDLFVCKPVFARSVPVEASTVETKTSIPLSV